MIVFSKPRMTLQFTLDVASERICIDIRVDGKRDISEFGLHTQGNCFLNLYSWSVQSSTRYYYLLFLILLLGVLFFFIIVISRRCNFDHLRETEVTCGRVEMSLQKDPGRKPQRMILFPLGVLNVLFANPLPLRTLNPKLKIHKGYCIEVYIVRRRREVSIRWKDWHR